jgi:O-Antigen ligase/Tetratricopeptide repeat
MLASPPVRAAAERVGGSGAAAATVLVFCALFFSGGFDQNALFWIGCLALAAGVLPAAAALFGVAPGVRLDRAGAIFLGCLLGLTVWMGASTVWSLSPDRSWGYTNRTLVYAAFALAGIVVGAWLPRPATAGVRAAAALLALLYGWALLAKCVPALYADYGRVARLRAPVGYWNELALLGAAGVPVALCIAVPRTRTVAARVAGVVLLYGAVVVTLLTYSRFGVVLAALAATAWIALSSSRVESLAASVLAAAAAGPVFAAALALPGITGDGEPRAVRAHDGWIFALALLAGAAAVAGAAFALAHLEARRPLSDERRGAVERVAAVGAVVLAAAAIAVSAAFAHRIWNEFANPASSQISSGTQHLGSLSSSNRWRWWTEEWQAFTEHPLAGTGAGTFQLTDFRLRQSSLVTTTEPHNTPLQFLGELGIVGLLLYLAAAGAAAVGIVAVRRRAAGAERAAVTALGLAAAVFLVHTVVDMDWNFVASCGPLLLVVGLLLGREPAAGPGAAPVRRPLVAATAVLVSLAGVYSLAAPWLAQRTLTTATTAAQFSRAHGYDPLSTEVLSDWAAVEAVQGRLAKALKLYRDEVALEPENGTVWYDLGAFYYDNGAYGQAYDALSQAWRYDPQGPTGIPCGLLDQARHKALGTWPPSCPRGSPRAASP